MDAREHGLAALKARIQSSACVVQENGIEDRVGWDGEVLGGCSESIRKQGEVLPDQLHLGLFGRRVAEYVLY